MKEDYVRLIVLFVIYFIYMVFGAFLFSKLEYENENNERRYLTALMSTIRNEHNLSESVMDVLSFAHESACSKGILLHEPTSNKWDFAGSFYFVGTVITTIGFGYISPVTRGGQIFFIPYALLGIPLNILLFNTLLERTVLWIGSFLTWAGKRLTNKQCDRGSLKLNLGKHQINAELSSVYIGCVSFTALIVSIVLISILFMYIEDWTYFEAVYFCVVAFTTVGFGDFVPSSSLSEHGKNHSSEYKIGNWILIVIGLIFMYPALAIAASLYKELISCLIGKCFLQNRKKQVVPQTAIERPSSFTASDHCTLDDQECAASSSFRGSSLSLPANHGESGCPVFQLGAVSTVEASIMRSRVSLRDSPQLSDRKSELENLIEIESRLTKEYLEAIENLSKQKRNLMSRNDKLTNFPTQSGSPAESGISLKVNSTFSSYPNSPHSFQNQRNDNVD